MSPETLTVEEVMQLFHVTRRTVYRWIDSGKIKGAKFGRRWLFDRAEILEQLKAAGK